MGVLLLSMTQYNDIGHGKTMPCEILGAFHIKTHK